MDHRQLEQFLCLADSLHFGRSSEALHISPSALSRSLQRLEAEVGAELFERDKRRVLLTAAGRRFLPFAEQVLAQREALLLQLNEGQQAIAGEISLYCSVAAVYEVLSDILSSLRSRYPHIDIKLHTGDQADAIERVLAGKEDFAIAAQPSNLSPRLSFQPLRPSPLQLIAPSTACAVTAGLPADGETIGPEHWRDLPFILPERGLARQRIDQWLREQGVKPNVYAQVSGNEAIASMVSLGLGVGVVPSLVMSSSPKAQLIRVLDPQVDVEGLTVGLACLKTNAEQPLLRAFRECAGAAYGLS